MNQLEEILKETTDTKACLHGARVLPQVAAFFGRWFCGGNGFVPHPSALVVDDVNTRRVAGEQVIGYLRAAGIKVFEHTICPDGAYFHATYDKVEEVREALKATMGGEAGASAGAQVLVPVAVGSGTINDLVKRASEELGLRYMVVGTAASMDGYTSYGASITKDGMKQTLPCRAPLGAVVDTAIAAAAPREMSASGYADLLAKIPAGADWMLAEAILPAYSATSPHGCEKIHPLAWRCVQHPLRSALANPAGVASGDEAEVAKFSEGLLMSAFAMQASGTSRPASGTEHQVSHYWDMENLAFNGRPVSHGFKVGVGTLASTATWEFLLAQDLSRIDVEAAVARWPQSFDALTAKFPEIYGNRPDHIKRAQGEMSRKYSTPQELRGELTLVKRIWPELSRRLAAQIMPFAEVREKLRLVGAPYEPEQIGVTRARFRETYRGVAYMRNRYFALDLVERLGLMDELLEHLFGKGGIWEV